MAGRPNVVWVTLDSVRADHTSLDGYSRDTTPEMERIAEGGTAFTRGFAHSNWTLASSGAILTGTHPSRNTLGIDGSTLPDTVPTVAERFSEAGYRTACLSRNSYLSAATGLDRGFDRFEWLASSTMASVAGPRTLAKYLLNIRHHSAGLTTDTAKHATPYLMNDIAARWLGEFGDDPLFFYLHYNEPHRPYYPPRPYLEEYTDGIDASPEEAAEIAMDMHRRMYEIVAGGCDLSDRQLAAIEAMYDAEIAYTDEMIGRLYDHVREALPGETVFVVTADHGELFGEHDLLSHKLVLDDAVTRVPLVVDGLDDLAAEADDVVSHVDLMRTLMGTAGADTDGVQGADLRESVPTFAVSQRGPAEFEDFLTHDESFDTDRFHADTLTAFRDAEYRYQTSADDERLFALPDERTDVCADRPDVCADYRERATEWLETVGQPITEGRDAEFSEEMERQLADLGYVE